MDKRKTDSYRCTIEFCPERKRCLLVANAQRCATFRAIVLRKLRVER